MGILKQILFGLSFSITLAAFAQDFSGLTTMEGKPVVLDGKQNKMLVYFWATWCPDCRDHMKNYMPTLAASKNFDLITIVLDKDLDRASQYVTKENIKLKTYRDPEKKLIGPLKVFSVPTWAVFEKQKNEWKLTAHESSSDDEKMMKALGEIKGSSK